MNTLNIANNGFSARLFAGITMLSLLLSAFPVAFFIANAATPAVLFSDDFESGLGLWTDSAGFWSTVGAGPTGDKARVTGSTGGVGNFGVAIPTTGYENITVSFDYRGNLTTGDQITALYDDGSGLISITVFNSSNAGDNTWKYFSQTIPNPSVNNNADFELLFNGVFSALSDEFDIDNVEVTGDAIVTVPAGTVRNVQDNLFFATIQGAIDAATTVAGETIELTADLTTDAQTTINKAITLDGNGFTLDADFEKTDNSNNSAIGIQTDGVTVKDIVLTSSGDASWPKHLHGINVYSVDSITLEDITVSDFEGTGVLVNSSKVTASDITTSNNGWHGMNVDEKTSNEATLSISETSSHNEPLQIYVDDIAKITLTDVDDVDSQYDITEFPNLDDVRNQVTSPRTARLYTLKAEEPKKVEICHWHQNDFNSIEVSVNSIENAHGDDTEDIIPVIAGIYPTGQNLDTLYAGFTGAEVLANDCVVPQPVSQCIDVKQNLLTNGSFEEPEVTSSSLWQKFGTVPGWTVTKVSDSTPTTLEIQENLFGNQAAEGDQYAELDGDHSTKVTQSVAGLQAGATYELSWAFAGRHNAGADHNKLDVLVNGSSVATEGPQVDPQGLTSYDWTRSSVTFITDSNSADIAFADAGPSNTYGTYLDDAKLCLVEEPKAMLRVCKIIVDEEGDITDGANTGGEFSVDITGPGGYNKTFTFTTPLVANTDLVNDNGADLDAYCEVVELAKAGQYKYTEEVVVAGNAVWATPLYHDFFTETPDELADFAAYTIDGSANDDNDTDGVINVAKGKERTLAMLNTVVSIPSVPVTANKIVCDFEEELPNWAKGNNNPPAEITATTATDWLAANTDTSCRLVEWDFQWSDKTVTVPNQYNTFLGEAPGWNTFSGSVNVPFAALNGGNIEFREVLTADYIPFSGGNDTKPSAELYCGNDVLNYDNLERVNKPKVDEAIHCVAWNVPKVRPLQQCTILSDTGTLVVETNEYAVETYVHNNWSADIDDATWVWVTEKVENPGSQETYTFEEKFTVDNPTSALLDVAADNYYKVYVNGTLVLDRSGYDVNFTSASTKYDIDILPFLNLTGENTITFEVTNLAGQNDYRRNPAGVLYRLDIKSPVACKVTTETEPVPDTLVITNPAVDNDIVPRALFNFTAEYNDNDPIVDNIQWAIRAGTCNAGTGTIAGNVDGFNNSSTFSGTTFTAPLDTTSWAAGNYCFVVNPNEQSGEPDLRASRLFIIESVNNEEEPDPLYLISGYKYEVTDSATTTVSGWLITATNGEYSTTTLTGEDGSYSFILPEGSWTVSEEMQTDWEQSSVYRNGEVMVDVAGLESCELYLSFENESSSTCDFYNKKVVEVVEVIETPENIRRTSSGGGRPRLASAPVGQVLGATTASFCPFLTEHMQIGATNDTMEVMKLQMFLNIFRSMFGGTENPVNGVFGVETDANVKTFQQHFKSEILDPWYNLGIVPHNRPTGFVYKTTLWKINSIVCPETTNLPSLEGEDLSSNIDITRN